jgi:hypothetical protein
VNATEPKYLRRDPAEVEPWAETCGQIRPLIEAADGAISPVGWELFSGMWVRAREEVYPPAGGAVQQKASRDARS